MLFICYFVAFFNVVICMGDKTNKNIDGDASEANNAMEERSKEDMQKILPKPTSSESKK